METIKSIYALENLQKELNLATDEMLKNKITKANSLLVKFPDPNTKNYVFVTVDKKQFPFHKSSSCNSVMITTNFNRIYSTRADFKKFTVSTNLYNNERDFLLKTPLYVRKKAIRDFEEELIKSKDKIAKGSFENAKKSLEKLKQSIKGKKPRVETYTFVPETEDNAEYYRVEKLVNKEKSVESLNRVYNEHIEKAKKKVVELKIDECITTSIGYGPPKDYSVILHTTPKFFPFKSATRASGGGPSRYGPSNLSVFAFLDDIKIMSLDMIPFSYKDKLLELNPQLKGKITQD